MKLKTISSTEARKNFAKIADELRGGRVTYSVRRYGREVMRLTPARQKRRSESKELDRDLDEFFRKYDSVMRELSRR